MRKLQNIGLLSVLFLFTATLWATPFSDTEPKVGDVLVIQETENGNYDAIKFPERNILHKKTGLSQYNRVEGMAVEVIAVTTNAKGETVVTIQPKDGSKFFRYWKSVKANYQKAIENGELK